MPDTAKLTNTERERIKDSLYEMEYSLDCMAERLASARRYLFEIFKQVGLDDRAERVWQAGREPE